jgi:hypothetical protein
MRVLRAQGLEPQDSWLSVRLARVPWPRQGMYTVIAYHAATLALARVLQRDTKSAETSAVGVWVLNEAEARQLCEDG